MQWKPVTQLFVNENKEVLNITFTSQQGESETIGTTPEHPFWVSGQGWTEAKNLVVSDIVTDKAGVELNVASISKDAEKHTTYNFEVAEFHTYFVGEQGVWVHNMCGAAKSAASRLADKAQSLPGKRRPNTVAVIKHKDGTVTVGRNQGGVQNSTVQNALDNAPANCFAGQCAEINALSRALNKGRSLDGATISVSNVRGAASTSGIHGTPKAPCTTCANVLDQLNVSQ